MTKRTILVCALLVACTSGVFHAATREASRLPFTQDLPRGLATASTTGRPVAVVFVAGWCPVCREMERGALRTPAILALADDFVWIRVDIDRDPSTARRFGVDGVPAVQVLDAAGEPLRARLGRLWADELERLLTAPEAASDDDRTPVSRDQPASPLNSEPNSLNRSFNQSLKPRRSSPMFQKIKSILFVLAAASLIHGATLAADEHNVSTGITTAGVPLGLHGVDPVALVTLNAVAEGDAVHTLVHDGVAYYFASQQSADMFSTDPQRYLPQYGGFCAYAVAKGKKFDGDPNFADIVNGKLYLFVNAEVFARYKADSSRILADAERMWPKIRRKAVRNL